MMNGRTVSSSNDLKLMFYGPHAREICKVILNSQFTHTRTYIQNNNVYIESQVWDSAIRRVAQITGIRWSKWEQVVRRTMLQLGDSWATDPALTTLLRDDGALMLSL